MKRRAIAVLLVVMLLISVWLPPSYSTQPDREHPVVYLLHGQNSSSVSYLNVDNIGGFMDNLSAEGKIVDMIVIMPDSGKTAFYSDSELADDGTSSGPWATQLSNELRLYVEDHYRTLNDAKLRAQMATFTFRYLCLPEVMGAPNGAALASFGFADEAGFDANFKDAINAIANLGVMVGVDDVPNFVSNATATRGMAAAVVLRLTGVLGW